MKRFSLLLVTIVGLLVGIFVVGSIGFGTVAAAVATIGWLGFGVFVFYTLLVLTLLALAWQWVAPGTRGHYRDFLYGRIMREAASETLPFSQLGGIVLGTRVVAQAGVPEPLVMASLIADITLELVAQLVFTLFGLAILVMVMVPGRDTHLLTIIAIGLGVSALGLGLLIVAQKPLLAFSGTLSARLLPAAAEAVKAVPRFLDQIYAAPARLIACFAMHIVTWFAAGAGAWIVLKFSGQSIALDHVLAIEALIFAVRAVAFFVPGALGVQEGAYLLIAPVFGLPMSAAIALSIIKRGRELAIGVPTLLFWQANELRAATRKS